MDAPDCFRTQLLAALPRVRRYARSLVFDPSLADDLTQSTVVRALSHWHQFDQSRDILVWLLSIAHNAFLDVRRRDARLSIADPADLQRMQDEAPRDDGDRLALRMDLNAALSRLGADQREALLLVCVEQLSYAEVAEVLSVPVGTVMSRVFRARATMRKLLEGGARPAPGTPAALRRVI